MNKGKELEIFVADTLKSILKDPTIRPTKASGGGEHNTEIADILSKDFYIECKNQEGKFFNKKVWSHLLNTMPFGSSKIPLYIIKDEIEGVLVMLSFADLCKILGDKNE